LELRLQGEVILPVSELNRMRRELVEKLGQTPSSLPTTVTTPPSTKNVDSMLAPITAVRKSAPIEDHSTLHVLCRTMEQIEAALEAKVPRIYVDFEDIRRDAEAVQVVRANQGNTEIFLATPRIQKSGEEGFFKLIERAEPDGVLIRNLGAIEYFAGTGLRTTGDFSLNVANPLTAEFLMQSGLEQLTVSYDLNSEQVFALLRTAPPRWFELTLHQHMPMFHMEHCVFCAFLSNGTDYTNCGRPCDTRDLKLRDRVGAQHSVKADVGCRNTVFNALAQTGAEYVSRMQDLGVRHFRLEFLNESAEQVAETIAKYRQLLAGEITGQQLWRELKLLNQLGVTRGQMGTGRG
jgi:putative protease